MSSRIDIRSLLNSPGDGAPQYDAVSSFPEDSNRNCRVQSATPGKQKLAKDAPVFAKGTSIVGHVNFPPHEAGDGTDLQARHRQHQIHPLGQIYEHSVRHIPYISDKKLFKEKTGREAFEVFQYTFAVPGDARKYLVVWDYNVGLVRMTPFFKSCKYSKTVPAKALNQTAGLKELSYSITGGALVCQGYWVPWHAARQLAATFCWDIRWALTPVFGNDFPQMCIPRRHPSFGNFIISPDIVRFCAEETARFRKQKDSYQLLQMEAVPSVIPSSRPLFDSPVWQHNAPPSPFEKAIHSTEVSPRSLYTPSPFTSVGRDASPSSPRLTWPPTPQSLGSPDVGTEAWHVGRLRPKRTHSKVAYDDGDLDVAEKDTAQAETMTQVEDHSIKDMEAADILLSLGVVARNAAALPRPKRIRRVSVVHSAVP